MILVQNLLQQLNGNRMWNKNICFLILFFGYGNIFSQNFYKQTILGPLWFFIQPLFTAAINLFVFGSLAGLGPQGVPGFLFYMSGPILWQYFQDTFTKTASTFIDNQAVFGKVYFPRLIMPLTVLISGLLKFGVQMCLLLCAVFYYYFQNL